MPKKVLIALNPRILEQVDFIAQHECRTRSDLVREALRRYIADFVSTQRTALRLVKAQTTDKPVAVFENLIV